MPPNTLIITVIVPCKYSGFMVFKSPKAKQVEMRFTVPIENHNTPPCVKCIIAKFFSSNFPLAVSHVTSVTQK